MKHDVSAIIVAGGSGTRMGRPKQMLPVNGKPVVVRSIEAFLTLPSVKQLIVVTSEEIIKTLSKKYKKVIFVSSGETRIKSLENGLKQVAGSSNLIAVHDGARPLVNPKDIEACLKSAAKNKAAVLAVPVKDTIKEVKNGKVVKTLDRSVLYAAQTPQCYDAQTLKTALKKFSRFKNATDESQLVEKLGIKVAIVLSDYKNLKITTPEDLTIAEALCKKVIKKK